jgi:hypothetical protein
MAGYAGQPTTGPVIVGLGDGVVGLGLGVVGVGDGVVGSGVGDELVGGAVDGVVGGVVGGSVVTVGLGVGLPVELPVGLAVAVAVAPMACWQLRSHVRSAEVSPDAEASCWRHRAAMSPATVPLSLGAAPAMNGDATTRASAATAIATAARTRPVWLAGDRCLAGISSP